jgi:hypothetical protein
LMIVYYLQTQGLYPKVHIDMEVSSSEDDVPKTDPSADKRKAPDGNDAEDGGAFSAEPIAPNPINSSYADRVASIVPPTSGNGHKHSAIAIR